MQEKFSIVAIAAVITAVFTTTIVMSLTVQPAFADTCSAKSGACVSHDSGCGCTVASTHHGNTRAADNGVVTQAQRDTQAFSAVGACGGKPGIFLGSKTLCAS